jgi:hypothetical protein
MGFFSGVKECNEQNGGSHKWGSSDYAQKCGGCGVTSWGSTPGEAMDNARNVDRANRDGRL